MKATRILLALSQLVYAFLAVAQTPSDPSPRRGLQPTGSYEIEDIETISKTNGNLTLNIPLGSIGPDRAGNSHGISLIYNSKIYEPSSSSTLAPDGQFVNGITAENSNNGGWQYGVGYEMELTYRDFDTGVCNNPQNNQHLPTYIPFYNKLRVVFPDGSKHLLRPSPTTANYFTNPNNTTNFTDYEGDGFYNIRPDGSVLGGCDAAATLNVVPGPMVYYTTDGTFITVMFMHDSDSNPMNNTWVIYFRDGSLVESGINGTTGGQEICDHDANCVQLDFYIVWPPNNQPPIAADTFYSSIQDSYGRSVSVSYGNQFHGNSSGQLVSDTIVGTGYGGTSLAWTVDWMAMSSLSGSGLYNCYVADPSQPDNGEVDNNNGGCGVSGPRYEVSTIHIPNDPTSQLTPPDLIYTFEYLSKFGEVSHIHLPYGAAIDYTYYLDSTAASAGCMSGAYPNSPTRPPNPATYVGIPNWWEVLADYPCSKVVTSGGSTEQSYLTIYQDDSPSNSAPFYLSSNFQGPDGGLTTNYFGSFSYNSASNAPWQAGLIYQVNQPDGSAVTSTWAQNPLPGIMVSRSDIGGANGQQQFYYDSLNPYIQSEMRTWGSQSSSTTYAVDVNGNTLTATAEPNWNSSATRTTTFTYMNSTPQASIGNGSAGPLDSSFANVYWRWPNPLFLSYPATKQVTDTASGTTTGDQFCYDPGFDVVVHARLLSGTSVSNLVNCSNGVVSANAVATRYNWVSVPSLEAMVLEDIQDARGVNRHLSYDSNYLYVTAKYDACGTSLGAGPPCTLPEARTTQFINDLYTGKVTQVIDADNHTATIANYDAFGRPTSTTDPSGGWTQTIYDDTNRFQMTTVGLDSGRSTVAETCYDTLGRVSATLKSETGQPLGNCPLPSASVIGTTMAYQYVPRPGSNDPSGVVGRYEWTSNPAGGSSGQAAAGWTRRHFDPSGRIIEEAYFSQSAQPAYNATNYDYGRVTYCYVNCTPSIPPNCTAVTDQAGNSRTTCVDAAGRISSASDTGVTDSAAYTYDVVDDLHTVTQGAQTRTFNYDPLGRLTSASYPEINYGTVYYFYDNNGNLIERRDPRPTASANYTSTCYGAVSSGQCTTSASYSSSIGYDGLNRPRGKAYTDGTAAKNYADATPTVAYTYDQDLSGGQTNYPKGHLVQTAVAGGTTVQYNRFDAMGRVLEHSQRHPDFSGGLPGTFIYGYNAAGLQTSVAYPSRRNIQTSYDNAGRVNGVTGAFFTGTTNYAGGTSQPISYWAHGAIYTMPLGNSLFEQWSYNPRLQPTQISLGNSTVSPGNTSVRGLTLNYGIGANNGNLQSQVISGAGLAASLTQSYQYDQANRITNFAESSSTCGFGYDLYGNGWSTTPGGICTSAVTPISASGYNVTTNQTNVDGASFDPAGNENAVGAYAFNYDAENRMVSSTISSEVTAYQYDGDGRRIVKVDCPVSGTGCDPTTPGSSSTWYFYDASGKLTSEYSTTPMVSFCTTCYVLPDHLGSTRVLTDGSGNPAECHDYQPFGRELLGAHGRSGCYPAAPWNGVLFTGKYRDWETQSSAMPSGLDYFGARYYSGAQGRFTSVDPTLASAHISNPQSWNRYSYALNNPLRYVDPNGELWVASGDASNPYNWVDKCGDGQTCYDSVAAQVSNGVMVYGSASYIDRSLYRSNDAGVVNVADMAQHHDANFESIQTAGQEENYLGRGQAAALFNVAGAYGQQYPDDDKLVFTGGSAANGHPGVDANGRPLHVSHQNGANIDLRYMGDDGSTLSGHTAAANGDVTRNQFIMDQFAAQGAGLGAVLTGDPARYGFGPIPAALQRIHETHMHFQRNYPAPPKQ